MALDIANKLLTLTKQLFPTGRAFNIRKSGVAESFNKGLIESENDAFKFAESILDSIIPDNDNFTETDALLWENRLAIPINISASLSDRKELILRKMAHPGNILARQHYLYIEGQLQYAGFDVYVHEYQGTPIPSNAFFSDAVQYGSILYGQFQYGQTPVNVVANYTDENKDKFFAPGSSDNLKSCFFIGGQTYPDKADIDEDRKTEFRELILRLKPAQTAAYLLINYI